MGTFWERVRCAVCVTRTRQGGTSSTGPSSGPWGRPRPAASARHNAIARRSDPRGAVVCGRERAGAASAGRARDRADVVALVVSVLLWLRPDTRDEQAEAQPPESASAQQVPATKVTGRLMVITPGWFAHEYNEDVEITGVKYQCDVGTPR